MNEEGATMRLGCGWHSQAQSVALSHAFVDLADLLDPLVPLGVLHLKDVGERPVEMVRDIRYLLINRF